MKHHEPTDKTDAPPLAENRGVCLLRLPEDSMASTLVIREWIVVMDAKERKAERERRQVEYL